MQKVTYNGITYKSVTVACNRLGITPRSVIRHTQKGLSVEQAIEQILKNKKRNNRTDHLGNEFESLKSMALAYWLPPTVLYERLKRKWDLKRALTTPIHIGYTDHLGNKFKSIADMAEFYHISYTTFFYRLHRKWSIERALTTPIGKPRGKYANKVQGQKI